MVDAKDTSFLARHEFIIRRLHSLSGLIPVGAYMVVHLLVNASVNDSAATFQRNVFGIHSLGSFLPLIEWGFIFIPLLFHAIVGVVIVAGGVPNTQSYPYQGNFRYTAQRATGMIAFAFIMWHVFHMHGWFHSDWWLNSVARPLGGAKFAPYNAASTLGAAMQGAGAAIVVILYVVGLLSCVFHLSNGLWTMGITWGVWVSQSAQDRARTVCDGFGVLLAVVGLSAVYGAATVDIDAAQQVENRMYEAKVESGDIKPDLHKRSGAHEEESEVAASGEHP
ncbi:MAG: succinate dehydrogenase cytochrome b558 subunit [Planctomycetales bacterium]|nr:succinate dehydrogenase cytochrome b558 subunit [Planctomycetales bacterium]